jgi:hypothetical protein
MKEKNYKTIIKLIVDEYQENLNDWEVEFIASVYNGVVLQDRTPSEKQAACILKLNRKRIEARA